MAFFDILHLFNSFFNHYIRESDNFLVHFLWTTANLFGILKVIIELKGALEFLVRHFHWRQKWIKGKTKFKPQTPAGSGILPQLGALEAKYGNGHSVDQQGKRCWAVITGGSDGIGAEYARQIARQGFNICLIARTQKKMENVQAECKAINPFIKIKLIQADFTNN